MTWKAQENPAILLFESLATSPETLIKDLEQVFIRLAELQISQSELLLYVNATNGNIFISGFDYEADVVFDDSGILVGLQPMWEENSNAHDFEEIILKAFEMTIKGDVGLQLKKHYKLFYQTEEEEANELN